MKKRKSPEGDKERNKFDPTYWVLCLPSMLMSIVAIIISIVQLLK